MIGIDQEPTRRVIDVLDQAFGPGRYTIDYRQDAHGVLGIVRSRDAPALEHVALFVPGLSPTEIETSWLLAADRALKTVVCALRVGEPTDTIAVSTDADNAPAISDCDTTKLDV